MTTDRRTLLMLAGSALTGCFGMTRAPSSQSQIRAVAFDGFAVFDPRSVFARCEQIFPGRGTELAASWRTKQFDYTWIRSMSGQPYVDFWHVTQDALVYAAAALALPLTPAQRDELMAEYLALRPWPDAVAALQAMKARGLRLALLTNFTPAMQRACVDRAGLDGVFEHLLSTDSAGVFKPHARAYELAPRAMGLSREQIAFAAFAGWDAAGSKWFGYRTFWINRLALPVEELGVVPDQIVPTLTEMAATLV